MDQLFISTRTFIITIKDLISKYRSKVNVEKNSRAYNYSSEFWEEDYFRLSRQLSDKKYTFINEMLKNKLVKMKHIILFVFLISSSFLFSQRLSDEDLKKSIKIGKSKMDLPFKIPGTDVVITDMTTVGRNILYTYKVSEDWYPPENGRVKIIESLSEKEKKMYIEQDVGLMYHYVRGKSIIYRVYIPSSELGEKTKLTDLGEYVSFKSHRKAKGVNIKVKQPVNFELLEGARPNIVAKFNNKENNLIYLIQINHSPYFISRTSISTELSSQSEVESFALEYMSSLDAEYVSSKLVAVDQYPTIEIIFDQSIEVAGQKKQMRVVSWVIPYEDKLISLSGISDGSNFDRNYYVFFNITNSVIFEDQYNNMDNNYVGDYENFEPYVDQFYRELEQSGIAKVRPKKINIRLESLDTSENTYHMHGFSTGFDNDDIIDITINKRSWNTFSKAQKYYLIFHELAHDVLNLDDLDYNNPNEKNIMYPSIHSFKSLSMDDFIDNFNLLLEEYMANENRNSITNSIETNRVDELKASIEKSKEDNYNITFKDGVDYNGKSYIESCAKSTGYDLEISLNYCHCMLINLAESLTSDEFIELLKDISKKNNSGESSGVVATRLLLSNELVKEVSIECLSIYNFDTEITISQDQISLLAENHLMEIKKELGISAYDNLEQIYDLKAYSECYINKMYKNFTQSEMLNLSESNMKLLEALQESCLEKNKK